MNSLHEISCHCRAHTQFQHGCVACYNMLKRAENRPTEGSTPSWFEWGLLVALGILTAALLVGLITMVEFLNALRGLTS